MRRNWQMVTPPTCSHTEPENRKQKKNDKNKSEENEGNAEVVSVSPSHQNRPGNSNKL